MDFEVQRCTRQCAVSGKPLNEGDEFYSALVAEGHQVKRLDYAVDCWNGPPEGNIGWWRSRVPTRAHRRARLAPNEVLLELFRELDGIADKQELRYVLALLLIRRRVLKPDESARPAPGEVALYSPRDECTWRVVYAEPGPDRIAAVQEELSALLAP